MDTSFGISTSFEVLSPSEGQVAYALLTRLPLTFPIASYRVRPFDLHVLSTPPAFILSQDRTLILNVKAEAFKFFPIQNSLSFVLSVVLLRINSRDLLIA